MKVTSEHRLLVQCICWERKSPRSFRVDRIAELICLSSGEVLDPKNYFSAFLEQTAPHSDTFEHRFLDMKKGLRVLLYISRCDGDFSIEEREAMHWYVEQRAFGTEPNWSLVNKFIGEQHPEGTLAQKGFAAIRNDAAHARVLFDAATRLANADGTLDPQEIFALMDLREDLGNNF